MSCEEETKAEKSNVQREEKVKIKATFTKGEIIVSSTKDIEGLKSRGYGSQKENGLSLEFFEALYLLSKDLIEIIDEKTGKKITFQDLLREYRSLKENAWVKYLIYRDLRSRGYVVREGFGLGIDFRVYERGRYGKGTADYLIYGIREGQPVAIERIAQTLDYSQNLKKKLILAVLNRRGEIVYYSLSRLTF